MEELERIRDLDDEIFEEYFSKIISSKFIKEYPTTLSVEFSAESLRMYKLILK